MAAAFLEGSGWPLGPHRPGGLPGRAPPHLKKVVGLDHQILLEADYLVNTGESGDSEEAIYRMREVLFRTLTGTALLDQIDLAR